MINAYNNFIERIKDIRNLENIYDQNIAQYSLLAETLSDILRFQLVYAVSAFDRFIHDIVRIGIVDSIKNQTQLTEKAKSFQIMLTDVLLISETQSPMSIQDNLIQLIDKKIQERHSELAFQQPPKISEALSHIWHEEHKWQRITENMTIELQGNTINKKEKYLKQTITLIINRRNQIVHEADIDLVTNQKRSIEKANINESVLIIEDLGNSIYKCLNTCNATN